jgi:hypothetical protein
MPYMRHFLFLILRSKGQGVGIRGTLERCVLK